MLGILSDLEIEEFLKSELIGRIGCHSDGMTYVVPVNYIYDDLHIYAHSGPGMKINMMRKNPDVCFEIDNIQSIIHRRSVIVWGKFEEITDMHEKQGIMQKLIDRSLPHLNGTANPSHGITSDESEIGENIELILYKIIITRKTGRFEKHQ